MNTSSIVEAYLKYDTPVDRLPYSDTIRDMAAELGMEEADLYRELISMRKRGALPRIRKSPQTPNRKTLF